MGGIERARENRNFLIKPASSLCNMRCRYCFYEDESENRAVKSLGVMSAAVADRLIEQAFAGLSRRDRVTFAFQGGEPTVAGLPFFRHFVEKVREENRAGAAVHYALQTNGLALDDEWCEFLAAEGFLVGVSVDGDKALHDGNRVDAAGRGTWNRVTRNLAKLQGAGAEVNLLCVVTRDCARRPQMVYNALKKLGVSYLQFIACLDPLETERGAQPWSLTPEDYGKFLCGLFDVWYRDWKAGQYVSVRLFDDFVHLAMGLPAGTCATSGSCGAYFVVEGDGGVYPCDFYVLDRWKLGDLSENTLEELRRSEPAVRFLREGARKPAECASCPWLSLCNGGCKRDWYEEDGELQNYYCGAFRMLFEYAGSRIAEIARMESRGR